VSQRPPAPTDAPPPTTKTTRARRRRRRRRWWWGKKRRGTGRQMERTYRQRRVAPTWWPDRT